MTLTKRNLSIIGGYSYVIIFFAAIFANFFVLDSLINAPEEMVENNQFLVRLGIIAFLITVLFDVVVAWALNKIYPDHVLSELSTFFRLMHAAIMGVAIFALPIAVESTTKNEILESINEFNIIWLIGLFFFGVHLILLSKIAKAPKWILFFLLIAGIMYMVDTTAHFVFINYDEYSDIFLAMVAIPSVLGEMSFGLWLLFKSEK